MIDPTIPSNGTWGTTARPGEQKIPEKSSGVGDLSSAVLSAALALLRDSSPVVRRSSAEYVEEHASEIKVVPADFSEMLLHERDERTLEHLIAAVPRFAAGAHSLVATLVFLVHDGRESIASSAAASLGDLGQLARGAFVPMWMCRGIGGPTRIDRLRELFEERLSVDSRRVYHAIGQGIDEISSGGHHEFVTSLRVVRQRPAIGVAEVPQLAVLHALCGVSDEARSEALRLCHKHPSAVTGGDLMLLEPALAAAMINVARPSVMHGLVTDFFHACSQLGPAPGIGSVLAMFDVSGDVDRKLLRDFAVASALRDVDAAAPIERTLEELWHPDAATVQAAASNLAVLAPSVARELGEKIMVSLFQALVERRHDGRGVVDSLVTGVSMIDGFDDEVVSMSGRMVTTHRDDAMRAAVAAVLGKRGYSSESSRERASSILRYLAGDGPSRAAEIAGSFLRS